MALTLPVREQYHIPYAVRIVEVHISDRDMVACLVSSIPIRFASVESDTSPRAAMNLNARATMKRGKVLLVHLIAAARPNFMKIAPLFHELKNQAWCDVRIVHTGQHYDPRMSDSFFDDLQLPEPDIHLGVGSGNHGEQTAGVMIAYERICLATKPDWIIVVGDVNSTLACALVGTKLNISVAHLEAGLRSGDRSMPEEINRLVTDAISDLLWTPSPDADENLLREGVAPEKIDRVGNIMIDCFELMAPKIRALEMPARLNLSENNYGVVTLHRPSNVDDPKQLETIVSELRGVAEKLPLVFPIHPRTRERLDSIGLLEKLQSSAGIQAIEPLGYLEFMSLVLGCRCIITDSGGIQEESSYLGIPCLTLRDNTERPITISAGTNQLISAGDLEAKVRTQLLAGRGKPEKIELWDGSTALRVAASLKEHGLGEG